MSLRTTVVLLRAAGQGPPASKAWLGRLTSWYPRGGGEFIGDILAGHSAFIADQARRFNVSTARHFSLVESLTITPLFALAIVHYFSCFLLFPRREKTLAMLMDELTRKTAMQQKWHNVLVEKSPADAVAWRVAMLISQITLFPFFILLSAIAPQLTHATLERTNNILYQKYASISAHSPPFVEKSMNDVREAAAFHSQQLGIATDYTAGVIVILLVLYLCW
ncbi:hypothetical protein ERJ75_001231700 [Trypanosoma vivax]|nr:hypothetical protein TRVL_05837 [Trypanosoma vivax]KAH8609118.1 hypothetical protein ERJ75_001231700 [Trypanosoma vivax]